jgi:hypothetical protein
MVGFRKGGLLAVAALALSATAASATPVTHNPGSSWHHLSKTSPNTSAPLNHSSTNISRGQDFCSVSATLTMKCDLVMKPPTAGPLNSELSHITQPLVFATQYLVPVQVKPGIVYLPQLFGPHWRDKLNFWDNGAQGMVSLVVAYIPNPGIDALPHVDMGPLFGSTSDFSYCSGTMGRNGCSDNFYTLLNHAPIGTPEPATLAVFGAGLAWLGFRRRK